MNSQTQNENWNVEYDETQGVPSSTREKPSASVVWALDNMKHLSGSAPEGMSALDVGCGTGRNAIYMADQGMTVKGFDASTVAIEQAKDRQKPGSINPKFDLGDLTQGLPALDSSIDLVSDIFVYKHLLSPDVRRDYRQEIYRVLRGNGLFLLSLADREDGFYSQCPEYEGEEGNPVTIIDEEVQIGSVLFNLDDLQAELDDYFELAMAWRKRSTSIMHGERYNRVILSTIWRLKSHD